MVIRNSEVQSRGIKILLFLIFPFGAFLYSIQNLKSKSSFVVVFLFFILFGYTFLPENVEADSYFYAQEFNQKYNYTPHAYLNDLAEYLTFESKIKDLYVLTCTFVIKLVNGNYHLLMALFASVFGYFYLKSLRFLVKRNEFSNGLVCFLLAFLFAFSNPIFNINGVRFWTASWVAVYALFQILVNKNYKYLFLIILTPLIHISYLSVLIVVLCYFLCKKHEKILVYLFVISFFITNVVFDLIGSINDYLPKIIQNMILSYTSDENLSERSNMLESLPLYAKILTTLPNYFINGLMLVFIYYRGILKKNNDSHTIFIFLLIWLTFVNLTWSIPSFGNRYLALALPFIAYLSLLMYKQVSVLNKLIYLIPIVFSYSILSWFRNMVSISDPFLYLSNLFHLIYKNL